MTKEEIGTELIQQYSPEILPKYNGESIVVENIGLIALSDNYKVEPLTGSNLYKITKIK